MTLDEMRVSTKEYLTPVDVSGVLKCSPYTVNLSIKKHGTSAYPFPLFLSGSRVRIPRLAFIEWAEKVKL